MKLLSMQGKVTDGQYINEPFVTAMNNPINKIVTEQCKKEDAKIVLESIWWEVHWDPGHRIDGFFEIPRIAYGYSSVVTRYTFPPVI